MAALRKKNVKIKTLATSINGKLSSHKACISVASLELEKQRHTQELSSLLRRVAELGARLKEITKEQEELAKLFLEKSNQNKSDLLTLVKKCKPKFGPEVNSGIFKIKY